jgi:hypothetical protein
MSERSDRTIGGNRFLLVLIIMVSVLVPGGLIIWSRMGPPVLPQADAVRHDIARMQFVRTDEPLRVVVYCPTAEMLVAESAGVRRQPDAQSQARETVSALLTSSCPGQSPVLKGLRLNALYLDPSGTAYVDLSAAGPMGGSVWDEFLAVYAVVDTLMQNFEDVKQVHFLVDGKESKTLAGHIDMSTFFSRRMDIVKQ